ncbi:MAG: hypothetical protein QOF68_1808 [Gaiellales bacterium]|nr:hypothetical protein [Gaiellales bacterium]
MYTIAYDMTGAGAEECFMAPAAEVSRGGDRRLLGYTGKPVAPGDAGLTD